MRALTILILFLSIYSPFTFSAEVGETFQMSRTLDFINLDTKMSVRVKRSSQKPYYLKILNKGKGYYDVMIVNRQGKALYDGTKMRVWKKYFDRGVYERTVDIIVDSTREVARAGSPDFTNDCADCQSEQREEKPQDQKPIVVPIKREYSSQGDCKHFAAFLKAGVPKAPLQQALNFYMKNKNRFKKRLISIADYSVNSRNKRFYILDLDSGKVTTHKVSHGSGYQNHKKYGDLNHDGMIDRCQGPSGSRNNMTRPGFFKVSELYWSNGSYSKKRGKYAHRQEIDYRSNSYKNVIQPGQNLTYGWPTIAKTSSGPKNGLRMDGLSASINDHARNRGVVMHGAYYNKNAVMGRSYGCPAFTPWDARYVLNKLTGGSLYYAFTPKCGSDMKKILNQVKGWEKTCK